jgi:hypothetical protein
MEREAHTPRMVYLYRQLKQYECRDISQLVAPSGDFSQAVQLGMCWQYPSKYTEQPKWSHSADTTNPCTSMVLEKGLNPQTHPMASWELWFRREDTRNRRGRVRPFDCRPQPEKELHEDFAKTCMSLANPKVILLFGSHVQKAYRQIFVGARIEEVRIRDV